MSPNRPAYRAGAVRPGACLREGWQLIRDDYWLFLGITFVGTLIAGLVPLGILAGPMMCGIYLCLMYKADGRRVQFETLFRGFDVFVQSLVATLLMMIPLLVLLVPAYLILVVGMISTMPKQGAAPDPDFMYSFLGVMGLFYLFVLVVSVVVSALFLFVYPLIADRRLTGVQAVTTSLRAAWANLVGVFGLVLLHVLLSVLGLAVCCVGQIFEAPLYFASILVAYRAVFPKDDDLSIPPAGEVEPDHLG